jgi:hypothetical protein
MGVAELVPAHNSTSSPVDKGIVALESRKVQNHGNLTRLDEHKLYRLTVVPDTRKWIGVVLWVTLAIERPSSALTLRGVERG